MGKMTESETKSETSPSWGQMEPLVKQLTEFFGQKGTQQGDTYSLLQNMFQNTVGQMGGLPDYITNTLKNLSTQGAGLNTPLEDTAYYKSTLPQIQRQISESVIPGVKEKFGASGALRSSDYTKAATRESGNVMGDFILNAALDAYKQEEIARQRQLGAAGQGIAAWLAPFSAMTSAAGAGQDIQNTQYPLLAYMIALLSQGKGQTTEQTTQESPSSLIPSIGFNIGL